MNPNIAMSDSNRQSVVEILNALLADEYVLYTKTRNYHWKVGGHASGTLAEFARHTRLKERPGVYPDAAGMLKDLLGDHESVIRRLREDLETAAGKHKDAGTSDFLTGLMEKHEKMAWMLRAFLPKGR